MLEGFVEPVVEEIAAAMDVLGDRSGVSLNKTCLSAFDNPSKADWGLLTDIPRVEAASDEAIEDGRTLPPTSQSPPGRIEPNSSMSLLGCLNKV